MKIMPVTHTFILVEGPSDIAFLSLYICHRFGFVYNKKGPLKSNRYIKECYDRKTSVGVAMRGNKEVKEASLSIVSCDGHTNIIDAYKQMVEPEIGNLKEGSRVRIIVLEDADENDSVSTVQLPILHYYDENEFLSEDVDDDFLNGSFGYDLEYKAHHHVLPKEGNGCLETVILKAIENTEPELVNESVAFVDGLSKQAARHITHRREKVKAKIGVTLSLINPTRTFDEIKERFEQIDLDNPDILKEFHFLDFLAKKEQSKTA